MSEIPTAMGDVEIVTGLALDAVGAVLNEPRNGRTDEDYRPVLRQAWRERKPAEPIFEARFTAIESRVLALEHTAARLARSSVRYRDALVRIDDLLLRWRQALADVPAHEAGRITLRACIDELETIMINAL